ncbi:MAG: hypothetical protein F6K50_07235 [Moorea sp. SIO3I7]|uniref:hypothetical protein n=1 Tax=Moorena sp. SIO3I8 TaxID=2607833 RepID=UPI0013BF0062|nr:hypothetical protein [Moorena sp. SIO3I8]NEN95330.1 hypothetical protein [Moorena sp. SIO3I7]NEO07392.1 hypothetical protein [Moorena sp. SIO3I8]NEP50326.1 hypothetical protein [Moorena sp. SIO3C2]
MTTALSHQDRVLIAAVLSWDDPSHEYCPSQIETICIVNDIVNVKVAFGVHLLSIHTFKSILRSIKSKINDVLESDVEVDEPDQPDQPKESDCIGVREPSATLNREWIKFANSHSIEVGKISVKNTYRVSLNGVRLGVLAFDGISWQVILPDSAEFLRFPGAYQAISFFVDLANDKKNSF